MHLQPASSARIHRATFGRIATKGVVALFVIAAGLAACSGSAGPDTTTAPGNATMGATPAPPASSLGPSISPAATERAASPGASVSTGSPASPSPAATSAGATPGTDSPPIPAGGTTLVARVDVEGGFVGPGTIVGRLPAVVVYADGSVYTEGPQIMIYPGPLLPNVQVRRISPAALARLIDLAREKGLLRDAKYEQPMIADAPTTVLTIVVDGHSYVQRAYALAESADLDVGVAPADRIGRANLRAFIEALQNVPSDDVLQQDRPYVAAAYRVFVSPAEPAADPNLAQRPVAWPFAPDLARAGQATTGGGFTRCLVVDGRDAATVRATFETANVLTPFVSGGREYSLVVRPQLPGESGC